MTGEFAVLGEQMRAGVAEAVADINRAGGVNGEQLVLEVLDDGCEPKRADAAANQFAGKGAALVVGHLCLTATLAAAPVYAANDIVQITPATTYPAYTDNRAGPGTFRLSGRDDQQGMVAGAYLAQHFGDRRIAVIDDMSPYGKGLADAARQTLNQAGVKETMNESFEAAADDYDALVARLKATGIEVVYIGAYAADAATIVTAMRREGMTTIAFAGDALLNETYWRQAGVAGNGTLVTFAPDPARDPANAGLVTSLAERGIRAEGYVLPAYAAVQVWAAAATQAKANSFAAVTSALAAGSFPSAVGTVSFDSKGDMTLPGFVVYEWRDGDYRYAGS